MGKGPCGRVIDRSASEFPILMRANVTISFSSMYLAFGITERQYSYCLPVQGDRQAGVATFYCSRRFPLPATPICPMIAVENR